MNLLCLHPKYLDKHGLISLWQQGLNAQEMLQEMSASENNSHLGAFREKENPLRAIGAYLSMLASEGCRQGIKLNHERILFPNFDEKIIPVKAERVVFDANFLKEKLKKRNREKFLALDKEKRIELNPIFGLEAENKFVC